MIKAYILSLNDKADLSRQWDFGFLASFLAGDMWKTPNWQGFDIESCSELPEVEKAIVAIPARHHKGFERKISEELAKVKQVVLFLMGDEEAEFDVSQIDHPKAQIWVQNPHIDKHDSYNRLGTGFPPHFKKLLDGMPYEEKSLDIYFAGQVTHQRRTELVDTLLSLENSYKVEMTRTAGFTQGEKHEVYAKKMASAKIAPCPSGAVIQDSFRLFESLEAMAVPIADQKTPAGRIDEYWDWLFRDITPFPKVTDFSAMHDIMPEVLSSYTEYQHKVTAWYLAYKRSFAYQVMKGLE